MVTQYFTLNTGARIPAVAIGGSPGFTPEKRAAFRPLIDSALKAGYRHIDGAWLYGTDGEIGDAVRSSGIPREDIFITTKLPWHHEGRIQEFFEDSLNQLGFDYVDLYLMHWPMTLPYHDKSKDPFPKMVTRLEHPTYNETWAEMEKIFASGKAKAIGVSNFSIKTLDQLLTTAKVVPAVNQVEIHPYLVQQDLLEYCNEKGIHVTAYTPTGLQLADDPVLKELAAKYRVSFVQIILAWQNARGVSFATQSSNEDRRKEALNLPELEKSDLDKVTALDRQQMAFVQLDEGGKILGATPEELGWEHIKPAEKNLW